MTNDSRDGKRPQYRKPEIIDFEYDSTNYAVGSSACHPGAGAAASCHGGAGPKTSCGSGAGAGTTCGAGAGPFSR